MNRLRAAQLILSSRVVVFGVFLSLFVLSPRAFAAPAPSSCPWVTQGSARAALGGSVSATVQVLESGEGSCTFTRQQGAKDTLKVAVARTVLPSASCPAESPKLKGVGNEAVLCKVQGAPGELAEMLISRVRELHFTVSVSLHSEGSQTADQGRAEEVVKQIAEQVAGNLF
jgi:hypothetical protein